MNSVGKETHKKIFYICRISKSIKLIIPNSWWEAGFETQHLRQKTHMTYHRNTNKQPEAEKEEKLFELRIFKLKPG